MIRRFSTNFTIFSFLFDALVSLGALFLMPLVRLWMNRFSFVMMLPSPVVIPTWIYVTFPLIWVVVLASFSIYDGKKFFKVVDELSTLTIASIIAAIAQAGILYLTYRDFSRALFLIIVLFTYLACVLWRLIFRLIFRLRKETLNLQQTVLIVGQGGEIQKIERMITDPLHESHGEICKLDLRACSDFSQESPKDCTHTLQLIHAEIQKNKATDVIIAFPRNNTEWVSAIASDLETLPLGVWVALDFYDLSLSTAYVENLGGVPMLDLRAPALNEYSRLLKRIFDLITAPLCLILLSPVMLIVALVVLIDSGWPIFFLQPRIGENGRLFKMIKFRTMVKDAEKMAAQVQQVDEDGNVIHKVRNDPRVTRCGHFLRRFSLDELPQFINVILGDMSMVGPRPELPFLAEKYEHWQRRRLTVPPGVTGWWQINGRSDHMMHLHTEDDIYYVENYSIWLDIRILIRTVWVVLIGNGSF